MTAPAILIVDDEDAIRQSAAACFRQNHFSVYEASCCDDALFILDSYPINIVLLDSHMPCIGGWETLQIIKDTENGWPSCVVVMMTILDGPEAAVKTWSKGGDYFISKPIVDYEELVRLVTRATDDLFMAWRVKGERAEP